MSTLRQRAQYIALIFAATCLAAINVHAQTVEVTAADPASALQGTVSLDVAISGSGFDSTAQVMFLVSGTTNPGGITVKKVVAKGPKKLIATIDVAETAVVDKFDIEVTLSSGRKGKGTTLFTVQPKTNSGDPCAAPGLDFPAFVYFDAAGGSDQIRVADADGQCTRTLVTTSSAVGAAFSYPLAGTPNVGRVVWSLNGAIYYVDFIVDGTGNTISSGEPMTLVADVFPGDVELSGDGGTVYYSAGGGSPESLMRIEAIEVGSQVIRTLYQGSEPGQAFNAVTVSDDETTLYTVAAKYVESLDRFVFELLRVVVPCPQGNACAELIAGDSQVSRYLTYAIDRQSSTIAYTYRLDGSSCDQLKYIDIATGDPLFEGGQPRYGLLPSWLGTEVLVNGLKPPDKRNRCGTTDMIMKIDPATGAETPLVRGRHADAR